MGNRKSLDKTEARARRDRLMEQAAQAKLPLFDAVREMRAIAGMTQEEFAQHRGVSARVIKELERGQGNPTVGTLNRIGEFFGLEVAFVPRAHPAATKAAALPGDTAAAAQTEPEPALPTRAPVGVGALQRQLAALNARLEHLDALSRKLAPLEGLSEKLNEIRSLDDRFDNIVKLGEQLKNIPDLSKYLNQAQRSNAGIAPTSKLPAKKKPVKDR